MAQSLSSILVHVVFSTKHRAPLIQANIEAELHAYLATVFHECQCPSLKIGGMPDHIHALFALHRTNPLAEIREEVKKRSSKWIKTKGNVYRDFQWQAGYGAFSVSQSVISSVREYIANQRTHHQERNFQDELRLLLCKHEIEFDERYLWD
jgi:putative transposase